MSKLTPKQEAFARRYAVHGNATKAAIEAGYSERGAPKTGHQLTKHAKVAAFLEVVRSENARRAAVDAGFVLEGLKREATGDGSNTTSSARVRALELLGKHVGMWPKDEELPPPPPPGTVNVQGTLTIKREILHRSVDDVGDG